MGWKSHGNQDSTHIKLKVQRVIILGLALDPHTCYNTSEQLTSLLRATTQTYEKSEKTIDFSQ